MGKVTKFTGSKLLGSELRRRRGGRTLAEMARLSHAPPLSERVQPVAAPTLCQVETGVSFPSLETLHTISVLYQLPLQQMLDLVTQERVLERADLPDDLAEAASEFRAAFGSGNWHRAMVLALRAEDLAESEAETLKWRANRAGCLQRLGYRQDALFMLLECVHDPAAAPAQVWQMYRSLAEAQAWAGFHVMAARAAERAVALAPKDLPSELRLQLLVMNASLVLLENEFATPPDAPALRSTLRTISEARSCLAADASVHATLLDIQEAIAHRLLGNAAVALQGLKKAEEQARSQGHDYPLVLALLNLGILNRQARRWAKARRCLEEAVGLAADGGHLDEAFEGHFELMEIAVKTADGRESHHHKRCQRFHPLLQARTPRVVAFERMQGESSP